LTTSQTTIITNDSVTNGGTKSRDSLKIAGENIFWTEFDTTDSSLKLMMAALGESEAGPVIYTVAPVGFNTKVHDAEGNIVAFTTPDNNGFSQIHRVTVISNTPPVADAGLDQAVIKGDAVNLSGSATDADGDAITSWAWTFDSVPTGSTASLSGANTASPSFVADLPGVYVLSLIVSDGTALSAPATTSVTAADNLPPTATVSVVSTSGTAPLSISFDGSSSTDPEGRSLSYSWDAGDLSPTGSGSSFNHTYNNPGTYTATLTVTDDAGQQDSDSVQITVTAPSNTPPTLNPTASPNSGPAPLAVNFTANASDADGDALSYAWDFGDGGTSSAENPSHSFAAGNYTVTLEVSDGHDSVAVSLNITATEATSGDSSAPLITPSVSGTLGDNGWYTSDVSVSWSVVDAESAVSASNGCESASVTEDTASVTFTCEATSEGGTASESVTIKRDASAPVIAITSPADGAELVLDSVVTAGWSASDAQSGIASSNGSADSGAAIDTASPGAKTFTVSATDNAGNSAQVVRHYTVVEAPAGARSGVYPVQASNDDSEEYLDGRSATTNSRDLELADNDGIDQIVGLRFAGVELPQGAAIQRAWIQFSVDEVDGTPSLFSIRGQAADNPPSFSWAFNDIADRPLTKAQSSWVPDAWERVGDRGEAQRSSDLAEIVQALVDRPGWASGNAMAFVIEGVGRRVARSFDDAHWRGSPGDIPALHIEYSDQCGPGEPDNDADGLRDSCDPDDDNDGTPDGEDAFPLDPTESVDTDGDGIGNNRDSDDDNDGIDDVDDDFPLDPTRIDAGAVDVEVAVIAGDDDAEEVEGSVMLGSSDLDLVEDLGKSRLVGIRFQGVSVPPGAVITAASLQFTADETHSSTTELAIAGQAAVNPGAFTRARNDLSDRARTAARVIWEPQAWRRIGDSGEAQRTVDLSAIVQELIDQPGWVAGNAMVFLVDGEGRRVADSFDGSHRNAPRLLIRYSDSAEPMAATPQISPQGGAFAASVTVAMSCATPQSSIRYTTDGELPDVHSPRYAGSFELSESATLYARCYADGLRPSAVARAEFSVLGVNPGGGAVIERRVQKDSDDAEERTANGYVITDSDDLEMAVDHGRGQIIALRFADIAIPRAARISEAWVQFTADEADDGFVDLRISGEASDAAGDFTAGIRLISGRPLTAAQANWTPPAWRRIDDAGAAQRTVDLSAVVQEIVDRDGWRSGNPLVLIIDGSGQRVARSRAAGLETAPLLHIEYSLPGGN